MTIEEARAKFPTAKIGYGVEIGNYAEIGIDAEIGNGAKIGDYAKIGYGAEIDYGAQIGNAMHVTRFLSFSRWYLYHAGLFQDEATGLWHLQLGCYTRPLSEWEADFWNNPNEFPNDGSEKSAARWNVFQTALAIVAAQEKQK